MPENIEHSGGQLSNIAVARTSILEFRRWWVGELVSLLPEGIRAHTVGSSPRILLHFDGKTISAKSDTWLRSDDLFDVLPEDSNVEGIEAVLAKKDLSEPCCELTVASRFWRNDKISVPTNAAAELDGVVAFEVERLTPFRADQAYFSYKAENSPSDDGQMIVSVSILPKRVIEPILPFLEKLGLTPITVSQATSPYQPVDTYPPISLNKVPETAIQRKKSGAWLVIVFALLIVASLASPFIRIQQLENQVSASIHASQKPAGETGKLISTLQRLQHDRAELAGLRNKGISSLAALRELSLVLPDDTWLIHVSIQGDQMVLEGRSRGSAKLVELLETSPIFASVKYTSAVTRDPAGGVERFRFSLRLQEPRA